MNAQERTAKNWERLREMMTNTTTGTHSHSATTGLTTGTSTSWSWPPIGTTIPLPPRVDTDKLRGLYEDDPVVIAMLDHIDQLRAAAEGQEWRTPEDIASTPPPSFAPTITTTPYTLTPYTTKRWSTSIGPVTTGGSTTTNETYDITGDTGWSTTTEVPSPKWMVDAKKNWQPPKVFRKRGR